MPPLMNLPSYQINNALLDFAPLNAGVDSYRKGQEDVRRFDVAQGVGQKMANKDYSGAMSNALMGDRADLAGVAMQAQSNASHEKDADLKRQYMQIDRMGRIAAAAADDPNPQNQAKAHAWLVSQHPNRDKLDPMYLDPRTGLKMMAAEAGQYKTEIEKKMEAAKLSLTQAHGDLYQAQATKAKAEASGDGASVYGKTGTIVQDQAGNYYSVQFGAGGQKKVEPLRIGQTGLTPSKGTTVVGDEIVDSGTGRVVRNVAPNIANAEQAKIEGREAGERAMGAPKAVAALESADAKTKIVMAKIEQALPMVSNMTAGLGGSILSKLPGTSARDLAEIRDTIVANLGFDELQDMRTNSPTGGALGAIAVQELAMLQKTKTSLEQAQSVPQLKSALTELQTIMKGSAERRQRAFQATYGNATTRTQGPGNPTPAGGAPRPTQPVDPSQIHPAAIGLLKSAPTMAAQQQFDEVFGQGAALRVLKGGQ